MTLQSPQPSLLQRSAAIARPLGIDTAGLSGTVLIVAGIDMMHRPSALIAGGLILLALSLLAARRAA